MDWNDRIALLKGEAGTAGDRQMVETCKRALDGDMEAVKACVDVIEWATNESAHMDDEGVDSEYWHDLVRR